MNLDHWKLSVTEHGSSACRGPPLAMDFQRVCLATCCVESLSVIAKLTAGLM